eukprot:TRINITY_DN115_c0_g2_i3.p1 TRINITY_DN115_c0_g2~~TRINITY_DN115_c0_g2_i3.p1  ORF type:complete len:376 (+),score=75.29 TRINITY_DN115_c0_g2_i3:30-1130(+)
MKSIALFLLISFVLFSCVESAFVFDRRLLNTTRRLGRDFTGSIRYGKFTYKGVCPTGSGSSLTGITIKTAATGSTCFTDASTASAPTIGYICKPSGGSGTIHFGYPGTDGFVIGGINFDGTGSLVADTSGGYTWGSVGKPTYSNEASTSCSASCTADYCSTSCTTSCSAATTASSASCTETTGSGGTFYFVPTGADPQNCGTTGSCCTSFTFCEPESMFTNFEFPQTQSAFGATGEYGIAFSSNVDGKITAVTYEASLTVIPRTVHIWSGGVSQITGTGTPNSGDTSITVSLSQPYQITAGQDYIVSINFGGSDSGDANSSPPSTYSNGLHLTAQGSGLYTLTGGALPVMNANYFGKLDIVFYPCT